MLQDLWNKLVLKKPRCVCHAQAKDLCHAVAGRPLKIECLCGEERVCERLREMGFCESAVVQKVAESGSLICKVCDAKVILSRELAENIIVKDICPCSEH